MTISDETLQFAMDASAEVRARGYEDPVNAALATLLAKACKTARAVILLTSHGLGQEGFMFLRPLLEATIHVRYLALCVSAEERTAEARKLLAFEVVARQRLFQDLRQFSNPATVANFERRLRDERAATRESIGEQTYVRLEGYMRGGSTWAGIRMKQMMRLTDLLNAWAFIFRVTSMWLHVEDFSFHYRLEGGETVPRLEPDPSFADVNLLLTCSLLVDLLGGIHLATGRVNAVRLTDLRGRLAGFVAVVREG